MTCPVRQHFTSRATAENHARAFARAKQAVECSCGRWRLSNVTPEQAAERERHREAERKARVAKYLATVPGRERS